MEELKEHKNKYMIFLEEVMELMIYKKNFTC